MHIEDGWDIINILFWAIIGIISCTFCYGVMQRNMTVYTLDDKSALKGVVDNTPDPYQWCVRDYLLMLMVADEYCPDPKSVDIVFPGSSQDTRIVFDDDYLVNMSGRLQKYYIAYLNQHVDEDIKTYDYYYDDTDLDSGRWRFSTSEDLGN